MSQSDWIDTNEAAAILEVGPRRIRTLCEKGRLDARMNLYSGTWQISRASAEAYYQHTGRGKRGLSKSPAPAAPAIAQPAPALPASQPVVKAVEPVTAVLASPEPSPPPASTEGWRFAPDAPIPAASTAPAQAASARPAARRLTAPAPEVAQGWGAMADLALGAALVGVPGVVVLVVLFVVLWR